MTPWAVYFRLPLGAKAILKWRSQDLGQSHFVRSIVYLDQPSVKLPNALARHSLFPIFKLQCSQMFWEPWHTYINICYTNQPPLIFEVERNSDTMCVCVNLAHPLEV
jgi:hypothetical protein